MPFYNRGKLPSVNDITSGTIQVMLCTSSYTPNVDDDFASTPAANEATGTGYVRKTLASTTATVDDTNDRVDLGAANLTWTGITSTFRYLVVFRFITNDAASPLIAYYDLGAQSLTAQDFSVNWASGVLLRIS